MKKILHLSVFVFMLMASSHLNAQSPIDPDDPDDPFIPNPGPSTITGSINGPSVTSCNTPIEYTFAPGFQVSCSKAAWTVVFPDGRVEYFSGPSIQIISGSTEGTLSVFAFALKKDCNISDNVQAAINTDVGFTATPSSLSGSSFLCNSETRSYTASAVSGAGDYTFYVPNGWRINNVLRNTFTTSSRTVSITAPSSGTGTGYVRVRANPLTSCGSSSGLRTKTVIYGRQIPVIDAITTELPTNGFGVFSSTTLGLSNFQWRIPSGWGASGGLNSPDLSVITGNTPGNFVVEVTARSCGSTVGNFINVTVTGGSGGSFVRSMDNEPEELNTLETMGESLTIFPNPARYLVNFKVESQLKIQSVEFFDIHGKKVYARTIDGFDVSLNVSDLPNGTYFANLLMEDGSNEVKRLLIDR